MLSVGRSKANWEKDCQKVSEKAAALKLRKWLAVWPSGCWASSEHRRVGKHSAGRKRFRIQSLDSMSNSESVCVLRRCFWIHKKLTNKTDNKSFVTKRGFIVQTLNVWNSKQQKQRRFFLIRFLFAKNSHRKKIWDLHKSLMEDWLLPQPKRLEL